MPSRLINTFLIAFISIFLAAPAFAWDDVGHKITGYIAWQRMSAKARENVIKVLRSAPEDSHLSVYYQSYGVRSEADKQLEELHALLEFPADDIARLP